MWIRASVSRITDRAVTLGYQTFTKKVSRYVPTETQRLVTKIRSTANIIITIVVIGALRSR